MVKGARRFVDTNQSLVDFVDESLVACPRCGERARVAPQDSIRPGWSAARRLTCSACGLIRECHGGRAALGKAEDPYFGLPLWLQAPCCGETLWAHNRRHLEYLERFVAAGLREHMRDPDKGWSNASMANRLPTWLKAATNRAEIQRAIEKLKERCP